MNADSLVSAAEIARLAGVTRAAVSNWRRRYDDFPAPVSGGSRTPLFTLSEINSWLDRHRKRTEVSRDVLVWQALRAAYGDDLIRGLADAAELLLTGCSTSLDAEIQSLLRDHAAENSPAEVIAGLTERYFGTAAGSDRMSTPYLARAVKHFAGEAGGTVFDPACGIGTLLIALGGTLVGQDVNPAAARLAEYRAKLAGDQDVAIEVGDSLREDRWSDLRAELVVCDPPTNVLDWGREELLLDPRWELGPPTRAESELAWLQHCYAHTVPGGRVIMVMPASVAYRKAGRRIRAELVRRGILTEVVALPAGVAASHSLSVHLWLLTRPVSPDDAAGSSVRMVDLTDNHPDGPLDPSPDQVVDVQRVDLLDEVVDLTPGHYVAASHTDHLTEYMAAKQALESRIRELMELLPHLTSGSGSLDGATVRVADLARAKLVEISEGRVSSISDQLDSSYLDGFVRSGANVRRSTSASGSYRADVRGARIPQMAIEEQRRYGEAFRALDEFERQVKELAELGDRAASLARDGLTSGALRPSPQK